MEQLIKPNVEVTLIADPQRMLDSAKKCADVLVKLVRERKLSQRFGTKEHLFVEAWQTVGHFYGVTGKIVEVQDWTDEVTGEQGFKATAQALHAGSGTVISEAQAICLNNEDNWSTRPKYEYQGGERKQVGEVIVPRFQLMSMAQTRAISKVLRNVFAFVVVLAGFDPTPAEEMTGNEKPQTSDSASSKEAKKAEVISEPQRKRIYGIAHSKNVPMPEIVKIIAAHGFKIAADITKDKYDAVVKDIENFKGAA